MSPSEDGETPLIVQELCKGVNCGFAARGGRSAIESVPLVTQLNES